MSVLDTQMPNGECRYFLTDQVDSVNVVLNDKGDAVTRTEYKPYGETWVQEGDKTNRPKFNSQELDPETGYYFYNARYYEVEIGRFITADNIIPEEYSTQSWNRYSYVRNNPIKYKDPTGHVEASEYYNQALLQSTESQKQRNLEEYNKIPYVEDCKSLPANAKGLYNIKGGKVIAMDYMYQGDNKTNDQGKTWRNTCSVTSEAIIFNFKGIKQKNPEKLYPDELYDEMKRHGKGGPKLNSDIQGNTDYLLGQYGHSDEKQIPLRDPNQEKRYQKMRDKIDSGKPIIAGTWPTPDGHVMVIVGYDKDGFIAHDPAGDRKKGYWGGREDGKYVHYSFEQCRMWEIGSGRGWTHTIERK